MVLLEKTTAIITSCNSSNIKVFRACFQRNIWIWFSLWLPYKGFCKVQFMVSWYSNRCFVIFVCNEQLKQITSLYSCECECSFYINMHNLVILRPPKTNSKKCHGWFTIANGLKCTITKNNIFTICKIRKEQELLYLYRDLVQLRQPDYAKWLKETADCFFDYCILWNMI